LPPKFQPLEIPEVILIEPEVHTDERGFFIQFYNESAFRTAGIPQEFIQDNHSHSKKKVLRGLHFQIAPKVQGKLVKVVRGAIFDVAVDLRKFSSTYGKWVGAILSAKDKKMLWIPPGFAHGFVSLEDETDVLYKITADYAPDLERGIIWNDPDLAIDWPDRKPLLSRRDQGFPRFSAGVGHFESERELALR